MQTRQAITLGYNDFSSSHLCRADAARNHHPEARTNEMHGLLLAKPDITKHHCVDRRVVCHGGRRMHCSTQFRRSVRVRLRYNHPR